MNYKEILARLTGFSVPVFGVSWKPAEPEIAVARRVIAYLEDRRLLYNPFDLEVLDFCLDSVLEIRKFLTQEIGRLPAGSEFAGHLRAIRSACRQFLDGCSSKGRMRIRPSLGSRGEAQFFMALGELRATVGIHIAAIAVMYGLPVEHDLAEILPVGDD
jgi:hypothetical protein